MVGRMGTQEDLLRYALYSRLSYFDYDVTTDDLCVVASQGPQVIQKIAFIDKEDTQLWIFLDPNLQELVVAFRGSDSMGDVLTNFSIAPEAFLIQGNGHVHGGHMKCYKTVRNDVLFHVMEFIKHGGKRVSVCGHSLGGACAFICALELAILTNLDIGCYSYGALAFADRAFCESLKTRVKRSYRVVHAHDFAPIVPMFFYRHYDDAQTCINLTMPASHTPPHHLDLHSKALHYIRHHSIESYIAGIRRLSKSGQELSKSVRKFEVFNTLANRRLHCLKPCRPLITSPWTSLRTF